MTRPPIHPGEILADEINELGMSASELARVLDVPKNRITEIINGQRGITADTALRLAQYFGVSAEFWMNLQKNYELRLAEQTVGKKIQDTIRPRGLTSCT
ncbi:MULTISPECIES: HigA family addiction module antitoxin [unclassified Nostoc]|uniref:HigA family addiction module antitoxin n=1 Tax=unclassified Nostoc TaxID=2593658 RepID=UPI000B951E04|nr:HigA family addiction module antitoxin [Nostoc sp. 'Peltigera membranacea cyanobiont' 232]OYE05721.1 addiction module antidote protein, HigA family [Nostoc sp. 'Peltigera membranacea cyanobiont' 232]